MSDMIRLGDCRSLPWFGAHVLITDPPYREHVHRSAVSQSPRRGVRVRDLGFGHIGDGLRDFVGVIAGKVSRWSVIYSDIESLGAWRQSLSAGGARYIRAIPWVRWSMPQLSGDRPPSGCEMLTVAWGQQRGKKSWNGPGNLTHFSQKCLRGEGKHKTEKPLDQALDLVEFFSNPGEIVADPFVGSGTIPLACKLLDRRFVGAELDPEWHARAVERVANSDHLSERDQDRFRRWLEAKRARAESAERIRANTARVRRRAAEVGA